MRDFLPRNKLLSVLELYNIFIYSLELSLLFLSLFLFYCAISILISFTQIPYETLHVIKRDGGAGGDGGTPYSSR